MSYFDGIRSGDKVYLWETPHVVGDIYANHFEIEGMAIDFNGVLLVGHLDFGQCVFWQPVKRPVIVAPPRPVKTVEDVGADVGWERGGGGWKVTGYIPKDGIPHTARIVFERPARKGE
jgi:hypothetical protein